MPCKSDLSVLGAIRGRKRSDAANLAFFQDRMHFSCISLQIMAATIAHRQVGRGGWGEQGDEIINVEGGELGSPERSAPGTAGLA